MKRHHSIVRIIALLAAAVGSLLLMTYTFSYRNGNMQIAGKAFSDFGAHIPLVRSFSQGPNFTSFLSGNPVESPLFPGQPIRYHFGFYALAGFLEKLGLRIDWALNIPSALGFFFLLVFLYAISYKLFANTWVSLLSVLFFLLNGSLSFLKFFVKHPLSSQTIRDIVINPHFPSFGPWDGGPVTAFWNLNIYTNQRHLALSYALVLIICWILLQKPANRKNRFPEIFLLVLTGCILMIVNYAAFVIALLFAGWLFLVIPKKRTALVISSFAWAAAAYFLNSMTALPGGIRFEPGYLVPPPVTVPAWVLFWIHNIGLHTILIPIGIIIAPKTVRKILFFPLAILFIAPNLFRFSPDMINNHKFFNFFMLFGNMFSAYAIIAALKQYNKVTMKLLRLPLKIVTGTVVIGLLTFSGIIDFFPIVNDYPIVVSDAFVNPDVAFFMTIPAESVVANSTWFYHPANIAGRPVFSGYTYFTWSYGYDMGAREQNLLSIYRAQTRKELCTLLSRYRVSYVELSAHPEAYIKPNLALWDTLSPVYENPVSGLRVFEKSSVCNTKNGVEY